MRVVAHAARAAGRRIDVPIQNGMLVAGKTDWLDSGTDATLSPNVFLVELPPGSVLDVHFHRENQFQLFVQGQGSIGPHRIAPVTAHYAGAFTGYGPLTAGPEGLSYFTIRPVYDTGAFYLPQARGELVRGPKRSLSGDPVAALAPAALRSLRDPEAVDLIAPQPDHLAARMLRLPPHASHVDLDPAGSGGQFLVVIGGSLAYRDGALGRFDFVFVSADEPAIPMRAQDAGAEVVLMQLPVKAPEYAGHGWWHRQQHQEEEL